MWMPLLSVDLGREAPVGLHSSAFFAPSANPAILPASTVSLETQPVNANAVR